MSNQKDHKNKLDLDSCYKLVQQNSATGGIRAVEIAEKFKVAKSTVHDRLNSLYHRGKVYSDQGLWKATTEETTIKTLEKEIVIELPLPEKKFPDIARLAVFIDYTKDMGATGVAKMAETIMEKYNETRTIKIKGKNVDDLDLEKIAVMIQQANEKSSKVNVKRLLKKFKP
jgi:predicted DNA-binding transcriptional regulator